MKKIVCLFSVLVLAMGLLVSCGDKKEKVEDIKTLKPADFAGKYDFFMKIMDESMVAEFEFNGDDVKIVSDGETEEMNFTEFLDGMGFMTVNLLPTEDDLAMLNEMGGKISKGEPVIYKSKKGLECNYTVELGGETIEYIFNLLKK